MLFTVACIVLITSILAFFSDEWIALLKKIFAIRGMKLILPLVVASVLVELFEEWGHWLLIIFHTILHNMVHIISSDMPFEFALTLAVRILCLLIIAVLPAFIFQYREKRKGLHVGKPSIYWLGLTLWLVAAVLFCIPQQ